MSDSQKLILSVELIVFVIVLYFYGLIYIGLKSIEHELDETLAITNAQLIETKRSIIETNKIIIEIDESSAELNERLDRMEETIRPYFTDEEWLEYGFD